MAASVVALLRDLAAYGGRGGALTAAYVAAGALLEGAGLALIVPLLSLVVAREPPSGWLERTAAAVFAVLGVDSAVGRLALLIAAFGLVTVLRALVIAVRDVRVTALQIGFAGSLRLRLDERLAAASWVQHATAPCPYHPAH